MRHPLKTLVKEFGWIHSGLGLFGNVTFVVGSVLFLPAFEPLKTLGVWLFIVGASFMFIGSLGNLMVKVYDAMEKAARDKANDAAVQASQQRQPEDRAAA